MITKEQMESAIAALDVMSVPVKPRVRMNKMMFDVWLENLGVEGFKREFEYITIECTPQTYLYIKNKLK